MIIGGVFWYCVPEEAEDQVVLVVEVRTSRALIKIKRTFTGREVMASEVLELVEVHTNQMATLLKDKLYQMACAGEI